MKVEKKTCESSTKFSLKKDVKIDEEGRLFLGDVHLFNCSSGGMEIFKIAENRMNYRGYFTSQDIFSDATSEEFDCVPDKYKYILEHLIYLVNCGVVEVQQVLFEVADNEDAERIVRDAVMMNKRYDILAPTDPVMMK